MKYGVSVYFDRVLMESGRTSMEKMESKTVEAIYRGITEPLKLSIAKSVKDQLKAAETDELFLTYDLEEFIRERREEIEKNIKHL